MSKTLLIVESGAKAKTIQKYLGAEFIVKASVGHIADLPKNGGLDRTTWEETYELTRADVVPGLKRAASADVSRILLASDPDREGEAIAWHLARELKSVSRGKTVQRVVYHEITAAAIRAAIAAAKEIAMPVVDAQRTRRVLDRVVGYDISSLVRRVNAKSAGRLQKPTLDALF
jgi:DNA topoisomerase-1